MENEQEAKKSLPLAGQEFEFRTLRGVLPGILSMSEEEWNRMIDILVSLGATVHEQSLLLEDRRGHDEESE